mmetsp:Transcript_113990/g.197593  ORF Transcript_113990/g.197593 Transcript_113990/m.197593 type:complete len:88 (+) Transcript_113990:117-380(+)
MLASSCGSPAYRDDLAELYSIKQMYVCHDEPRLAVWGVPEKAGLPASPLQRRHSRISYPRFEELPQLLGPVAARQCETFVSLTSSAL